MTPRIRLTRRGLVNLALVVAAVAVFAVPLALGWGQPEDPGAEAYVGTDNSAVTVIEQVDPGYRRWFEPLFAPSSPSVESGLFALQAAIGAGVLGFVLGRLSGRARQDGGNRPTEQPRQAEDASREPTG